MELFYNKTEAGVLVEAVWKWPLSLVYCWKNLYVYFMSCRHMMSLKANMQILMDRVYYRQKQIGMFHPEELVCYITCHTSIFDLRCH